MEFKNKMESWNAPPPPQGLGLPNSLCAVHPSSPLWERGPRREGRWEFMAVALAGNAKGVRPRGWDGISSHSLVLRRWAAGERRLSRLRILYLQC